MDFVKYLRLLPLVLFLLIMLLLWRGLGLHPTRVPSPLIDKPAPSFQLPTLLNTQKQASAHDFKGRVTLFNVWASWCVSCVDEHKVLLNLSKDKKLTVYGLNYKDNPKAAKKWLKQLGNPYQVIAMDAQGNTAIDWGVYGTPETFIIDKKGVVRYKLTGPLSNEIWEQVLKSFVQKLQNEPT